MPRRQPDYPAAMAGEDPALLRLTVAEDGERPLVTAEGEIDLTTTHTLAVAISDLRAAGHRGFTINLDAVRFIDSTGVALLGVAVRDGVDVRVIGASEHVARVLRVAGLANVLESTSSNL